LWDEELFLRAIAMTIFDHNAVEEDAGENDVRRRRLPSSTTSNWMAALNGRRGEMNGVFVKAWRK